MKKLFFVLLILNSACEQIEQINDKSIQRHSLSQIKLIDTFDKKLELDTLLYKSQAEFHPLYIGEKLDSIFLNYNSEEVTSNALGWRYSWETNPNELKIFIDTTQLIGSLHEYTLPIPPTNFEEADDWEIEISTRNTQAYPIIIENISNDTLILGYGEHIPLIIEAQDSLGIWKPIQEPFLYFCGTGIEHFYIAPNQIAITSCKLFEGDYTAKMRLAFVSEIILYSNEFYGQVKYSQFEPNEY